MKIDAVMALVKTTTEMMAASYPMLTRNNYLIWAIKMRALMRAQGVWDAVKPDDPSKVIGEKKDQMALAAIYQSIPEDTLVMIAEKQTTKEAWEALKTMHLGDDRIKEARVQTLKSKFEKLQMKGSESVDDFALRLTTIVNGI